MGEALSGSRTEAAAGFSIMRLWRNRQKVSFCDKGIKRLEMMDERLTFFYRIKAITAYNELLTIVLRVSAHSINP